MNEIKSFIFFDLETTGIPDLEFFKTKITEIALIACSKDHILETPDGDLPRVLHKQTFCINPMKRVDLKATEVTGLSNYLLEYESCFNENTAQAIICFIKHLQQPVCLVAHNGDKFDFILLRKELERLNISLPDDLQCIDSLKLFQDLDAVQQVKDVKEEEELSSAENSENELVELETATLSAMEELESCNKKMKDVQKCNETTPHRPKNMFRHKNVASASQSTPTSTSLAIIPKSRRRLFPEGLSTSPKVQYTKRKRFRLTDIYERFYHEEPKTSHYAECDCEALLKCAIACSKEFVKYSELNSKPFSTIKPYF